jgi:hypothetical protein
VDGLGTERADRRLVVYDAVMTSRRYSEEFLTHTIEDLGDANLVQTDTSRREGERP